MTDSIHTQRLSLHSLPLPLVAALATGDLDTARSLAPHCKINDRTFADDSHVLARRYAQMLEDPSEEPWLYRVAVLRREREFVGRIGFHSPPDAAGTVEIGFRTAAEHRRQGFATEMARGLLAWCATQGARRCLASVRPNNAASLATITRLGFVRIGEQIDEVDGLEWVHELGL